MFWRQHAQRLLVERGKADVGPASLAMAANPGVDAIGLNTAAIHALWTLKGLGVDDEKFREHCSTSGLKHASAGVRRNSLAVLPRDDASTAAILASGVLNDKAPQVRLEALLVLSEVPKSEAAAKAIAELVAGGSLANDRWLPDAATAAAAKHDVLFLEGNRDDQDRQIGRGSGIGDFLEDRRALCTRRIGCAVIDRV